MPGLWMERNVSERTSECCDRGFIEGTDCHADGLYFGICAECNDHARFVTDEEAEEA